LNLSWEIESQQQREYWGIYNREPGKEVALREAGDLRKRSLERKKKGYPKLIIIDRRKQEHHN